MMRKLSVAPDGSFIMESEHGPRPVNLLVRHDGVVCAEYAFNPPARIEITTFDPENEPTMHAAEVAFHRQRMTS